jgi:hypothetical protein
VKQVSSWINLSKARAARNGPRWPGPPFNSNEWYVAGFAHEFGRTLRSLNLNPPLERLDAPPVELCDVLMSRTQR